MGVGYDLYGMFGFFEWLDCVLMGDVGVLVYVCMYLLIGEWIVDMEDCVCCVLYW